MEGNSTSEIGLSMDRALTGVMPDSWHGHARLTIGENDDLSDKQKHFAERLSARLLDKGKVSDAERAAVLGIKKAQEKL